MTMSEGTTTAQAGTATGAGGEAAAQQAGSTTTAQAGGSRPAGGSQQTFTQDEVNRLLAKERRTEAAKYEGFDEYKAAAERLAEIEEASKSDLEKAQAAAQKWEAEAKKLKADADRREAVAKAAAEHGVDAEMLARMAGDPDENARFLAEREAGARKYPSVRDNGYQGGEGGPSKEDILKMSGAERVRAMGANPDLFRDYKHKGK